MTDEELMQAVCNGNQSAYQELVKQHLKSISHYAFRMLGNPKDTEDITQETFLKLWINAKRWQPEKAKLSTWLHRITHNLCIDYLRKNGSTQTQDFSVAEREDESRKNDLQDAISENAEFARLDAAIKKLPENQRSALMLCHYAGFSNKEAAAIMNVSVKALESAIARARHSLRTILTDANAEPTHSEEKTGSIG
jgi:RNA polymerase sigma-70 factor, ECF subfamily